MEASYRLMGVVIGSLPWVSAIVLAVAAILLSRKYRQTGYRWLFTVICGIGVQLLAFVIILAWTNFYWVVTGPVEAITQETMIRVAFIEAGITLGNQLLTILGTIVIVLGIFRGLWHQQDLETVEEEPEPFETPYMVEEYAESDRPSPAD